MCMCAVSCQRKWKGSKMKNRDVSKTYKIDLGKANNDICPGCIIIEGGGFRGIYGAAALDVLMENHINLQCLVGVSAGALNGMNYISGQIGRAATITLNHRLDKNYVGLRPLIKDKGIFGFGYAFGELMQRYPFDWERFNSNKQRFVITATNLITGDTEYFEKGKCDIFKALQASSSLPYVSKPVVINGIPYLDGGCSNKLPYKWALENGYKKIIVIKTQHGDFRKPDDSKSSGFIAKKYFYKYKDFAKKLEKNNEIYNRQLDELDKLKNNGDVFVISPSSPVDVKRFDSDIQKLYDLYEMGYNDTVSLIPKIKEYLEN